VNVFLGLGLPWVIGAIYELNKEGSTGYMVKEGSLGFSVVLFLTTSTICLITLVIRRFKVGGELGGSPGGRWGTFVFFCILWLIYIVFSSLQSYEVINIQFG